jgi:hypothetical protein
MVLNTTIKLALVCNITILILVANPWVENAIEPITLDILTKDQLLRMSR